MSANRALLVSMASALSAVVIYLALVCTSKGQRLDQLAANHLSRSYINRYTLADLLQILSAVLIVVVVCGCAAATLLHRRWERGAAAALLVVGANVTSYVLKHWLLTRPDLGFWLHENSSPHRNSLPSGHMTAVASMVLAALIMVPRRGRWLVAVGGSLVIAVTGVGTVVAHWHRPSDVLAALGVTLAWGALCLALLSWTSTDHPASRPTARPIALAVGLAVAAGLFLAIGVRPDGSPKDVFLYASTMSGLAVAGALVVGLFLRMVDVRLR